MEIFCEIFWVSPVNKVTFVYLCYSDNKSYINMSNTENFDIILHESVDEGGIVEKIYKCYCRSPSHAGDCRARHVVVGVTHSRAWDS